MLLVAFLNTVNLSELNPKTCVASWSDVPNCFRKAITLEVSVLSSDGLKLRNPATGLLCLNLN